MAWVASAVVALMIVVETVWRIKAAGRNRIRVLAWNPTVARLVSGAIVGVLVGLVTARLGPIGMLPPLAAAVFALSALWMHNHHVRIAAEGLQEHP